MIKYEKFAQKITQKFTQKFTQKIHTKNYTKIYTKFYTKIYTKMYTKIYKRNLLENLHKKLHYSVDVCVIYTNCGVFSVTFFSKCKIFTLELDDKKFFLDSKGIKLHQNISFGKLFLCTHRKI